MDTIEIHADAIKPGDRVLIVDDLIATGGTADAAIGLVHQSGGEVVAATFIIDLPDLGGAATRLAATGRRVPYADVDFEGALSVQCIVGDSPIAPSGWGRMERRSRSSTRPCFRTGSDPFRRLSSGWTTRREAIRAMQVRGAPLIGAAAAYGVALAMRDDDDAALARARRAARRDRGRPRSISAGRSTDAEAPSPRGRAPSAWPRSTRRGASADEDVESNRASARTARAHRMPRSRRGRRVNVLTHCNAGWLARVDFGTALAPIYRAHERAFRCTSGWTKRGRATRDADRVGTGAHGVPHTLIADNAGGHLMQQGKVDLCIVGADRVTRKRRRRQQDRHLSKGGGGAATTACRSTWRCPSTIDWTIADAIRKSRSRSATRMKSAGSRGRGPDGAPRAS